jgi:hypothetical protein
MADSRHLADLAVLAEFVRDAALARLAAAERASALVRAKIAEIDNGRAQSRTAQQEGGSGTGEERGPDARMLDVLDRYETACSAGRRRLLPQLALCEAERLTARDDVARAMARTLLLDRLGSAAKAELRRRAGRV